MDLPELINCSYYDDDDDDEGEFVDYCYNTINSYASTLSIHTINEYNESGFQNYQDENSALSNNRNDFTVSDSCKKGYQSYNKILGKNKTRSNLSSVISLLNFQASTISDQRKCITTKWNLGFNPTIQKFQFLVTELFDIASSGFEFITISVKLPRNDPKKWHHYISHSSYQHIMASFNFRNLSTLQRLNNNIVSHEKKCILTQVWLLDGTEKEVSTAVHRLDSLVSA